MHGKSLTSILVMLLAFAVPVTAMASEGIVEEAGEHGGFALVFLFLVLMLVFARVGALAERFNQPSVLGELIAGIVLAALAFLPGLDGIERIKENVFIRDIAEIGVILLLFRTGLESNLSEMKRVGLRAFIVACVGVVLPFVGGYLMSQWLVPGHGFHTYLFIGATLTATSVGITARVFKDLNILSSKESKIVLGAAVIDDILGLLILAVVAGIVSSGTVSVAEVGIMTAKAIAFLVGSIALGRFFAPRFGVWFSRIHSGIGMKMALALLFCGFFSYGAAAFAGLAPIVGAFAAGLVLDPVHFRAFAAPHLVEQIRKWKARVAGNQELTDEMERVAAHEEHAHVEQLIDGVSHFFVPIFFVYTGLQVDLKAFFDAKTLGIALAITVVAFVGKVACGYAAGSGVDKKIIGFGMVPRGEVGLIFANVGRGLGVVDEQMFAVVVIMVVLSTLLTPPILGSLVRRKSA